jgi:hypothetical protein
MNKFKDLLEMLGEAPDGQLDKSMAVKFAEMAKKDTNPTAKEVLDILDQSAYAALASQFTMIVMDHLWKQLKELEAA